MPTYRPALSERQVHLCIKAFERQVKDYERLAERKATSRARSTAMHLAWEYGALYSRFVDRAPGNPHYPPMQAKMLDR